MEETISYSPDYGIPKKDVPRFNPGDAFGDRFNIIEEIGRGGMGRVYKAKDNELNTTVALKVIRPKFSSDKLFVKRLIKETLIARSISHENVIRIHDIGEVADIKYISMDYISGENLKELVRTSGKLTVETAVKISIDICESLKAAHKKGIVHRDLKPQNIMVDKNGTAYTMDFGLARAVKSRDKMIPGSIYGTPQYTSPEQARGEEADERSDIYSFGTIMYEMVTGEPLVKGRAKEECLQSHIKDMPTLPSKINPRVTQSLENIILKCLEKERDKRYQNVDDVLKDLKEPKAMLKAKNLRRSIYITPIILFIAVGIYLLRKGPAPHPPSEGGRIPVIVMYFENHTGDASENHWGKALSISIITDLLQSKYIKALSADRLFTILKSLNLLEAGNYSSEDLKKIAIQGSVNHILYGYYTKAENIFGINAMLKNVITGDILDSMRIEEEGETAFYAAIDKITPWVKSQLNIGSKEIAADSDKDIRDILTASPEALKLYALGKQYYLEEKYEESNASLEKATEIDPGFALAYKRISENYDYLGKLNQAKKYAQKAFGLLDRVSDRDRFLVQGWAYTVLEDSNEKAIETYKQLLQVYPDDEDGNTYLGAIYREMEEWDLAIERFEIISELNPNTASLNLALLYRAKGLYDKARKFLQSNQHNFPRLGFYHTHMGLVYLCQGKYDLALLEMENSLSRDPEYNRSKVLIGNIHHLRDNFQSAEGTYRKLLDKSNPTSLMTGRLWLALLYLSRGQYEKCHDEIIQGISELKDHHLESEKQGFLNVSAYMSLQRNHLDEALDASSQIMEGATGIHFIPDTMLALHFAGLTHVKMDQIDEAQIIAEQMSRLIEKTGLLKYMKNYYHLLGLIAQNTNRAPEAIEYFKKAISLLPHQNEADDKHAFFLYPLAQAYYRIGDLEEARVQFEEITFLTTGRLHWGDLYAKSFYQLGKICQKKSWPGKAIEYYEKFLQLWKDADPGIPEVADAKEQLSLLIK